MSKRRRKTASAKTRKEISNKPSNPEVHHTFTVVGTLYRSAIEKCFGNGENNPVAEGSIKFILNTMLQFKARDPVEEMLLGQMVLTYGRMIYLTTYADQQTNIKWATMMHEGADRAANTFRRQMLALAEYRRPPRPKSFTAIGQANIAQQQVVQNRISENEKPTNEQGSSSLPEATQMLPSDAGRPAIPTRIGASGTAMAFEHGTEDTSR